MESLRFGKRGVSREERIGTHVCMPHRQKKCMWECRLSTINDPFICPFNPLITRA